MPLHLETFLKAHLFQRPGDEAIEVSVGVYDDLPGNLLRAGESSTQAVAVVIEWPDLDPRLGLRRLGGWRPDQLPDILNSAKACATQLESLLADVARHKTVAVVLPSLPLPPVSFTCSDQAGGFELGLLVAVNQLALSLVQKHGCRMVNPQQLNLLSPLGERSDVKADFHAGFPYTIAHASVLAELLARIIRPSQPRKGLITDLDDTVWDGILGEVGVEGISWDLDNHSQIHGLYQQLLTSLADSGALIAVASKNELPLVMEAFEREDLLFPKEKVFPFEVNWGRKSESIQRILGKWNIGPEAVVFVDDSLMEVAEVRESHPQIDCYHFPKGDDQACFRLLQHLRDLFGKESISEEDTLRRESLLQGRAVVEARDSGASFDTFLQGLGAELTFDWSVPPQNSRAIELINKTNQFNLSGRRINESQWRAMLQDKSRLLLVVSYQDKFGPLGKICVLSGTISSDELTIDTWVMSCRAFSRRIEYACLNQVFRKFDINSISLDYVRTERNGPVLEFLQVLHEGAPEGMVELSREEFNARCPRLFNSTKDI
jgi:FkbH-like protein